MRPPIRVAAFAVALGVGVAATPEGHRESVLLAMTAPAHPPAHATAPSSSPRTQTDPAAPPEHPSPQTVELAFHWPANLAAKVETRRTRTRHYEGMEETASSHSRHAMRVRAHDRGLVVAYEDFSPTEPAAGGLAGELDRFMDDVLPEMIVSETGEFLGVEGVPQAQERILHRLRATEDYHPMIEIMLDQLVTAETLEEAARLEWFKLVGAWTGREMVAGETVTFSRMRPVDFLNGTETPFNFEVEWVGWTACPDGAARCAELVLRSAPDPEALQTTIDRFVKEMGGGGMGSPEVRVEELRMDQELRLLAEPDGLFPHRLEIRETRSIRAYDTGALEELSQETYRVTEFQYWGERGEGAAGGRGRRP